METLYDRLGGQDPISKVVDVFYDNVLADETVNKFFEETDMEKQRRHQYCLSAGHWADQTNIQEEAWSSHIKA
ncbi:hypothetical protein G3A_20860 [Bacillus sp. 17376]|uniref:Globin n=1 Tax=Mesobacillus boroniphilus JCM 21738 TaxID=1294265 RepID=W4RTS4_9BACI|nr:hypothetical protein G3A_20860 [Bacillus sp. 17376]GAE47039.1 hypothetical protein JCM21738_3980 [Mesobacillus boroniphilus JCM 21738]